MIIKGFIFDLDGVLVDTAKYHYLAWKKLADEMGLHFNIRDNELLKGVSRERSFEIILELNGKEMSREEIQECCTRKNGFYVDFISRITPEEILPGAREFLTDARSKGIRTAKMPGSFWSGQDCFPFLTQSSTGPRCLLQSPTRRCF